MSDAIRRAEAIIDRLATSDVASFHGVVNALNDLITENRETADALEQCQVERDLNKEDATEFYAALKKLLAAKGDHMTACDRTMGATHPCTCGANEARQLFAGDTTP